MIRWVFYHCAIAADKCCLSFCHPPCPTASEIYGLKPLTLRWQDGCFTTVLLPPAVYLFAVFSLPMWNQWTQTFDFRMIKWVFYHCAIVADQSHLSFCHFLSPAAIKTVWTLTLDLRMIKRLFYHCAIIASDQCHWYFLTPSLFHCRWNLSTQTFDLKVTGWVFYHCAIASNQCCLSYLPSSLSRCNQNCLDTNPWPLDDQVGVLPLCYCRCPMLSILFAISLSRWKQNRLDSNPMTFVWLRGCSTTVLLLSTNAVYLFAIFFLPLLVKSMHSNLWP